MNERATRFVLISESETQLLSCHRVTGNNFGMTVKIEEVKWTYYKEYVPSVENRAESVVLFHYYVFILILDKAKSELIKIFTCECST